MKFDIIVGNPPYLQGMHMKILEKCFDILKPDGELIFIHPSTNFISLKPINQAHNKITNKIEKYIKSIELINGNSYFNAGFLTPCSITYIQKNKINPEIEVKFIDGSSSIFNNLKMVNQIGNFPEIFSLINKVKKYPNIWDNRSDDKRFHVFFTGIRGNKSNLKDKLVADDFWTVIGSHIKVKETKSTKKLDCYFSFNTKLEATNFLNYLKTNFVRRLLSFYKYNANLHRGELSIIPWLNWSEEWTDKKLKIFFNLTDKEIDFINLMPKYYET